MKYSWKGHKDRNRHKNRIKRSVPAWLVYVIDKTNIPTTRRWVCVDTNIVQWNLVNLDTLATFNVHGLMSFPDLNHAQWLKKKERKKVQWHKSEKYQSPKIHCNRVYLWCITCIKIINFHNKRWYNWIINCHPCTILLLSGSAYPFKC